MNTYYNCVERLTKPQICLTDIRYVVLSYEEIELVIKKKKKKFKSDYVCLPRVTRTKLVVF